MSRLTSLLGVEHPLIQAPMAGTSTPALAAAVSNAGALGSIAVGAVDAAQALEAIRAVKAATDRAFNVNLFCHAPAARDAGLEGRWLQTLAPLFRQFGAEPPKELSEIYRSFLTDDAMLAMLLAERPRVVSFHFGLPDAGRIAALKGAGCVLLATATSPEEGRLIQAAGLDAVVAQGMEAGGHRGAFEPSDDLRLGTLALTRLLVRDLDIPVIASGGIMDGAGIAAALALGAEAVQLGTAFVGCPESAASGAYRAALAGAPAGRTRITSVISGRPARGMENAFMRRAPETEVPAYPVAYDAGKALNAAAQAKGDHQYAAQWAGQAAPLSRTLGAAELVAVLMDETRAAIRDLNGRLG